MAVYVAVWRDTYWPEPIPFYDTVKSPQSAGASKKIE